MFHVPNEVQARVGEIEKWIEGTEVAPIADKPTYDKTVELTKAVKVRAKEIDEIRVSITGPLNESLKAANDFFNKPIRALQAFEAGLKRAISTYISDQERERLRVQREADEAARKERDRINAQAARLEDKGKVDAAQTTRQMADTVVAPVVAPVEKGAGVYNVTSYQVAVTDKTAFVRWALEGGRFEYLTINESLLKKEAQATKGERTWPGVSVTKTLGTRTRA